MLRNARSRTICKSCQLATTQMFGYGTHIHTTEYHAATRMNALEPHAATWVNPTDTVWQDTNYGQSGKYGMIPFMRIWEQAKWVYGVSQGSGCPWGWVSGRNRRGAPGGLIRMVCVLRSGVELLVPWMCSSGEIYPAGNVYPYNVCFLKCIV